MLRCIRVECNQPEVDMTILAWVIINANRDYANFLHYLDISSPGILVVCGSAEYKTKFRKIMGDKFSPHPQTTKIPGLEMSK